MDPVNAVSMAGTSSRFQVQVAVAKEALDTERAQGDAMVEMIKLAAAVGESLNAEHGTSLDVYA